MFQTNIQNSPFIIFLCYSVLCVFICPVCINLSIYFDAFWIEISLQVCWTCAVVCQGQQTGVSRLQRSQELPEEPEHQNKGPGWQSGGRSRPTNAAWSQVLAHSLAFHFSQSRYESHPFCCRHNCHPLFLQFLFHCFYSYQYKYLICITCI